jgi:protein ImuB
VRVACVDVPAFPLQLLRRAHPHWSRGAPIAVVEEDHPQARILWIDGAAAREGVRIGMRYNVALTLSRGLRAAPIPEPMLRGAREEIFSALHDLTPKVEPDRDKPGVFWLDPSGLGSLFGPLERWAEDVYAAVHRGLGLACAVIVGFARFPSWAVARTKRGPFVLESHEEEAQLAGRAPLALLEIEPELRDALAALGITTLEGFLALPRGEVGVRFGPDARTLHALFADAMRPPMQALEEPEPLFVEAELETPDDDLGRLLFCIKGALHALTAELSRRALALSALTIRLEIERIKEPAIERIEPARATRDALALLELVRLRLSAASLRGRVERIVLEAEPSRQDGAQLSLFAGRRTDPDAAARGIARLRASFGDDAVTRAVLRDAWLPEASFVWEPVSSIDPPRSPPQAQDGVLVRRLLAPPEPLAQGGDGRPRTHPPITQMSGPYRLQGGFWDHEHARDYFYAEREDGALLWVFRDRKIDAWFLHGLVC